tara:strand:+ start:1252 stop:1410 length:159 start_codon:yes stop_codon:yes gene_type:complete
MSEKNKSIYRGPDGAGKGDKPRISNKKKYDENWEKIFGKKSNKKRDSVEVED